MRQAHWLREDVVHAIHLRQLAEHGGASGIRDAGLLQTALARPLQLASYGNPPPNLAALAASYGYGLAHLHPFVDGNKRTSLVATLLFLAINGQHIEATQQERYETWLALAAGDLSEAELAAWLHQRIRSSK